MKQTTKSIDGSLLAFLLTTVVFTSLAVNYAATMPVLVDEYAHVPAGVSYLEFRTFSSVSRESPARSLLISDSGLVSFPQDGLFLLRRG